MSRSRRVVQGCVAALALGLSAVAQARTFHGFVTHVTDGDSLWVREGSAAPREVRLQGIDAPEICQAGGRAAREALVTAVLQRQVLVQTRARDRYQRVVARVFVGARDVGEWLVASGHAWSDVYRGRGGPYALQQQHAMSGRRGLWAAASPMPPREFRRRHGSCH